jgi:hypothetical protein
MNSILERQKEEDVIATEMVLRTLRVAWTASLVAEPQALAVPRDLLS